MIRNKRILLSQLPVPEKNLPSRARLLKIRSVDHPHQDHLFKWKPLAQISRMEGVGGGVELGF